jgi:isopentenyl phosphate kinase
LTGGMKKKVEKLLWKGPIYILNGYNFKNLKLFFSDPEKAIFTKIV